MVNFSDNKSSNGCILGPYQKTLDTNDVRFSAEKLKMQKQLKRRRGRGVEEQEKVLICKSKRVCFRIILDKRNLSLRRSELVTLLPAPLNTQSWIHCCGNQQMRVAWLLGFG